MPISLIVFCTICFTVPRQPACIAAAAWCLVSYKRIGIQSAVDTPIQTFSSFVITASTPSIICSRIFAGSLKYSLAIIRELSLCIWCGTISLFTSISKQLAKLLRFCSMSSGASPQYLLMLKAA